MTTKDFFDGMISSTAHCSNPNCQFIGCDQGSMCRYESITNENEPETKTATKRETKP